ncbi:MAG: hypothetical protein ACI9P5_004923 [Saprospiraceae bacterium]|jgi:hypothetical protein
MLLFLAYTPLLCPELFSPMHQLKCHLLKVGELRLSSTKSYLSTILKRNRLHHLVILCDNPDNIEPFLL